MIAAGREAYAVWVNSSHPPTAQEDHDARLAKPKMEARKCGTHLGKLVESIEPEVQIVEAVAVQGACCQVCQQDDQAPIEKDLAGGQARSHRDDSTLCSVLYLGIPLVALILHVAPGPPSTRPRGVLSPLRRASWLGPAPKPWCLVSRVVTRGVTQIALPLPPGGDPKSPQRHSDERGWPGREPESWEIAGSSVTEPRGGLKHMHACDERP